MILTALKNIFSLSQEAKSLYEEIGQQRIRIKALIAEQKSLSKWNYQYSATLSLITETMQAMIWKKDKHHHYVLANPLHCRNFFGLDGTAECLQYVVGRSDNHLIDEIYTKQSVINTFGSGCYLSDEYCKEQKETVHYLEGGVINKDELLLYVVKTPQYTVHGEFIGSIGMAWDVTLKSHFLIKELNRWIYNKRAHALFKEDKVFSYVIDPTVKTCDIFKHICPAGKHSCGNGECNNNEFCPAKKSNESFK